MKYQDVKWYEKYGKDVAKLFGTIRPQGHAIGYYHPSNANWSYEFKIVKFKGKIYEVMTQFGTVKGGREVILQDNE